MNDMSNHSCPVCQNCQNNRLQDERLQVFVCGNCGHVFSENNVAVETIYNPDYYLAEHKNWFLHPNFKLFGIIESCLKNNFDNQNINILDVGCGRGDLLHFLHSRQPDWNLWGIDVSENKEDGITYLRGDFVGHDFNREFNAVVGLMVIEHIPDLVSFVKKISTVLSGGGMVFLVTINSNSVIYGLARILRRFGWRGPYDRLYHHHHLQHFNSSSLRRLMEKNDFTVVKQYSHNFPLSALDLPQGSRFLGLVYYCAIACMFFVTNIFGGGLNQTIICKKKV